MPNFGLLYSCHDGLLEWLDKEAVGRHDDGYDAESATVAASGSDDELTPYPQMSSADTGSITNIGAGSIRSSVSR